MFTQSLVPALARLVDVEPTEFRRLLNRGRQFAGTASERLLAWAFLLRAVHERKRAQRSFNSTARELGLRLRTLERCSVRLLGCTLTAAANDPSAMRTRFEQWRDETRTFGSSPSPPLGSVRKLAACLGVDMSTLHRHWRADFPLRCGIKRLLSWAGLFWIVRQRERGQSWGAVTSRARCSMRTAERRCRLLARCTLKQAVEDPFAVRAAFGAWTAERWKPPPTVPAAVPAPSAASRRP